MASVFSQSELLYLHTCRKLAQNCQLVLPEPLKKNESDRPLVILVFSDVDIDVGIDCEDSAVTSLPARRLAATFAGVATRTTWQPQVSTKSTFKEGAHHYGGLVAVHPVRIPPDMLATSSKRCRYCTRFAYPVDIDECRSKDWTKIYKLK